MKVSVLCVLVVLLASCKWVKPTEEAMAVTLVKPAHVANCQVLGSTSASTQDKVGFVSRKKGKVADELINLARNQAASMGGDTIVAEGAPKDGNQSFKVYKCR